MESRFRFKGFTLAGICVAVLIVGISARAAFPVYGLIAKSQKEEELKFMLRQFSRAIFLYKEKTKASPTSLEALYKEKLLRKKYVNPFFKTMNPDELKGFEGFKSVNDAKNQIEKVSPFLEVKTEFPQYERYNSWYYKAERKNSILIYTFHEKSDSEKADSSEVRIPGAKN